MNHMAQVLAALLMALACGCLSVVRIPLPRKEYSDEGYVTNTVWTSFCDEVKGMRGYPTIKMRCCVTAEWWRPIPADLKCEELHDARMFKRWGWIPLSVIWLTAPLDACADTIFLPYDLYCVKQGRGSLWNSGPYLHRGRERYKE